MSLKLNPAISKAAQSMLSRIRLVAQAGVCAFAICASTGLAQSVGKLEEALRDNTGPGASAQARPFALAAGPKAYLADANGKLGTLDLGTGAVKVIGNTGRFMTDIAFCPGGKLFGIYNFNKLYRINPANAQKTLVGSTGVSLNALVCNAAGNLLAMGPNSTYLFRVNSNTGKATKVGNTGFRSAGDLSFYSGYLLMTSTDRKLVWLNPATGAPLTTFYHGIVDLWGLITVGSNLYGFANNRAFWFTNSGIYYYDFSNRGLSKITGATY